MTSVRSEQAASSIAERRADLPPLKRDVAFWGMTTTQFLGAFNDNVLKQLILLLCLDFALQSGSHWQTIAQAIFAIPFVLLSGFAGWLSDRYSKRSMVVLCKVAEIFVMGAGLIVFLVIARSQLEMLLIALFFVLAFASTQSAFFGPPKYGILPELFHDRDLPAANGWIQMTTFLAIIFGTAFAGLGKDIFATNLWVISVACVFIGVVGTATSLKIRKTPVAHPGLPLRPSSLLVDSSLWGVLLKDGKLLGVLLISSLFWMIAGLVPMTVNAVGKLQLGLSDTRTSLMAACMGIGIAGGCVIAGKVSAGRLRFGLVTIGAWGLIASFLAAAIIGYWGTTDVTEAEWQAYEVAPLEAEPFELHNPAQWPAYLVMIALGGFAGLFAVPLQVFLQHRPPAALKGRMIGAMNLVNWIGILLSAGIYWGLAAIWGGESRQYAWIFAIAAALLLPVALFYRPKNESLEEISGDGAG